MSFDLSFPINKINNPNVDDSVLIVILSSMPMFPLLKYFYKRLLRQEIFSIYSSEIGDTFEDMSRWKSFCSELIKISSAFLPYIDINFQMTFVRIFFVFNHEKKNDVSGSHGHVTNNEFRIVQRKGNFMEQLMEHFILDIDVLRSIPNGQKTFVSLHKKVLNLEFLVGLPVVQPALHPEFSALVKRVNVGLHAGYLWSNRDCL